MKTCHLCSTMICKHRAGRGHPRSISGTDEGSFSHSSFRYTYNPSTSKWSLLTINAKKKKVGGSKKRRAKQAAAVDPDAMAVDEDVDMEAAPEAEDEEESEDDQVRFKNSCFKKHPILKS